MYRLSASLGVQVLLAMQMWPARRRKGPRTSRRARVRPSANTWPSVTATSSGRRPLSGDTGSVPAMRMNLSRSVFARVKTAEPTLAMIFKPDPAAPPKRCYRRGRNKPGLRHSEGVRGACLIEKVGQGPMPRPALHLGGAVGQNPIDAAH